ncbi:MAG: 50S ribosomal protein L10 [Planctomycetota bacterium]|nr:MAG: 50S ribosomal protein L10 [Planctomycetota bacterium]
MSKLVKGMITEALKSRYAEMDSALLVEFVGVDGVTTNEFRRALHDKQMRMEIVKNSLFRRAVSDTPLDKLNDHLTGPNAVLTGGESLIDVAKLIEEWKDKLPGLKLKAAVLDGEYIGEDQIESLHKMPTKADLQARIVSIALSPGGNVVGAVLAGGANLAGCVKALIEKLEKGEEIKKSA